MSQNDIPKATARRLPFIKRAFNSLAEVEKEKYLLPNLVKFYK